MVYKFTKLEVLKELRSKFVKKESRYDIAKFAENLLNERIKDEDSELEQFLIDLACMQAGPEYVLTDDQLEERLDNFHLDKDVLYERLKFAKELIEMISKREPISFIGAWAHDKYYEHISNIDLPLGEFLLQLGTMEIGPEFSLSYEELESFANILIAGEDVKL